MSAVKALRNLQFGKLKHDFLISGLVSPAAPPMPHLLGMGGATGDLQFRCASKTITQTSTSVHHQCGLGKHRHRRSYSVQWDKMKISNSMIPSALQAV